MRMIALVLAILLAGCIPVVQSGVSPPIPVDSVDAQTRALEKAKATGVFVWLAGAAVGAHAGNHSETMTSIADGSLMPDIHGKGNIVIIDSVMYISTLAHLFLSDSIRFLYAEKSRDTIVTVSSRHLPPYGVYVSSTADKARILRTEFVVALVTTEPNDSVPDGIVLLKAPEKLLHIQPLEFGASTELRLGMQGWEIGGPANASVRPAEIDVIPHTVSNLGTRDMFRVVPATYPGSSGSAFVKLRAEEPVIVGINSASYIGDVFGSAIPILGTIYKLDRFLEWVQSGKFDAFLKGVKQ